MSWKPVHVCVCVCACAAPPTRKKWIRLTSHLMSHCNVTISLLSSHPELSAKHMHTETRMLMTVEERRTCAHRRTSGWAFRRRSTRCQKENFSQEPGTGNMANAAPPLSPRASLIHPISRDNRSGKSIKSIMESVP